MEKKKEENEIWQGLQNTVEEIETIIELAKDSDDESLNKELSSRIKLLEDTIKKLRLDLLLSRPYDDSNAIVTLHAGAGGTESCDWTEMLFRMYSRWASKKNFKLEILDISKGEEAGIRSIVFMVKGKYAYGLLKGEKGVHRLVRISPFDANKRRHTSFASCDVVPEVEEEEIEVKENEIKVDTYGASGHGGQHLQKTESAVRITHIPTGIVVQCQTERSQIKNREMAMKLLKARLYQLKIEQEQKEKEAERQQKGEIGWGRQRRSYVFMPYQLVKDNISEVETSDVEGVLDGEIDLFIESYLEKNR